jgi:hypothetical protein
MKHSRTLLLLGLPIVVACGSRALAEVVRPAPEIAFSAYEGKTRTLSSFKGQPIILLLADSPTRGSYRAQLKELENAFDRLAIRSTVIAAGFKNGHSAAANTNVPVVQLPHGEAVCNALKIKGDFAIVLVGPDGNIDYQTGKVLNINRILEVMQNSYEVQKSARKG